MKIISEAKGSVEISLLCHALDVSRATAYRKMGLVKPVEHKQAKKCSIHPRALRMEEKQEVLDLLHSKRFIDASPGHVYATLLDEGKYLCSERTMYRLLTSAGENQERRSIIRHRNYKKPELLATGPNQVWSWDITKLYGPEKWNYFYLYVILDIFSRYAVGWMVADRESGQYAKILIEECLRKQNIPKGQLTIHIDRGSPMKSKPVGFLLADLGVTKSFGRPQVSNDNPFSEAQFKTLKYCPEFPERFGSKEDAIAFNGRFFTWYNSEHKHSGIGYYTPEDVHYGRATAMEKARNMTLASAYALKPERFVRKKPVAPPLPKAVWINPPQKEKIAEQESLGPSGPIGVSTPIKASSAEAKGQSRARALALVAEGDVPLEGPESVGHQKIHSKIDEDNFTVRCNSIAH